MKLYLEGGSFDDLYQGVTVGNMLNAKGGNKTRRKKNV